MITAEELNSCIRGCALNSRESQKKLYSSFYGYAAAVCDRYCNRQEDVSEILNDGFLKIFKEIHQFKAAYTDEVSSFKGWLRKIMVYTAIDHFRKNNKHTLITDIDNNIVHLPASASTIVEKISYDEIIRFIQEMSPAYRTVLNLFIIDGFSHEEISTQLGISVGTSKSNLAKARKQLQKILYQQNQTKLAKNAG